MPCMHASMIFCAAYHETLGERHVPEGRVIWESVDWQKAGFCRTGVLHQEVKATAAISTLFSCTLVVGTRLMIYFRIGQVRCMYMCFSFAGWSISEEVEDIAAPLQITWQMCQGRVVARCSLCKWYPEIGRWILKISFIVCKVCEKLEIITKETTCSRDRRI